MTGPRPTIRAVIDGADISRTQVQAWERRRMAKASRRIGLTVPDGDLESARLDFAQAKLDLGATEIRRRLRRALAVSDPVGRATAAAARGGRVTSTCDLHVVGGDASTFVSWFTDDTRLDYEHSMISANPDHFLIATAPDGRQEVIETTGGSPLPTRFFVDYEDHSSLRTPTDRAFSTEAAGVARSANGMAIGGVRHQFRDTDEGFHARLTVEFPSTMLRSMVLEHRWHLAVEFSNWVHLAFAR